MRPLDFDLSDTDSFVIPDYSGENRFSWADMAGNLLHKSHCIPITDEKRLQESAPAVAQGWRSFISFSPDKHNTCCVRIDKFIIERRTFIFYIYRSRFHQFKITDNSLNTAAISAGQTITITEAINVYRVSLASSTFISVRAPSYTTNTV